ncbi:MAG: response regulator, partial [Myxococcota bacterium]
EDPQLILSDWNMPEMSGIELLDKLAESGSKVKFGFVTSEGSDSMRQRATESGALFLIAKPFNADTFKEILSPHVS